MLIWMDKEFKEWTTSFHMALIGTANSKTLDSKKTKVTKASDKPKHPRTTCIMCRRFYYE